MAAKKEKYKTFDLYEYRWLDHHSNNGWQYDGNTTRYECFSVGYLIGEDKEHLVFTDGIVPGTGAFRGSMCILKSCITHKKKINSIKFEL